MPNAVALEIEDQLRPIIGTVLATVSVDVETKRIGKDPETVERSDIATIADNLVGALRLVLGQDLAEAAARKVRALA
jgi:hypothetical protein